MLQGRVGHEAINGAEKTLTCVNNVVYEVSVSINAGPQCVCWNSVFLCAGSLWLNIAVIIEIRCGCGGGMRVLGTTFDHGGESKRVDVDAKVLKLDLENVPPLHRDCDDVSIVVQGNDKVKVVNKD